MEECVVELFNPVDKPTLHETMVESTYSPK